MLRSSSDRRPASMLKLNMFSKRVCAKENVEARSHFDVMQEAIGLTCVTSRTFFYMQIETPTSILSPQVAGEGRARRRWEGERDRGPTFLRTGFRCGAVYASCLGKRAWFLRFQSLSCLPIYRLLQGADQGPLGQCKFVNYVILMLVPSINAKLKTIHSIDLRFHRRAYNFPPRLFQTFFNS